MMTRRVVVLAMVLVVAFLVCDTTEKGKAWGRDSTLYAQSGTDIQRTADTENAVRAQFMDSVKREDNLADAKDHWFKIYTDLFDLEKEFEKEGKKLKEQIAKAESHIKSRLRNSLDRLNSHITSLGDFRALAVRQYALLLKLEKVEEQNQRKGLGKGDYLQEKRMLLDEINRVEQIRFWRNFGDDLRDSVLSLKGAIHETAQEVENTADAIRSIPRYMK